MCSFILLPLGAHATMDGMFTFELFALYFGLLLFDKSIDFPSRQTQLLTFI